MTTAEALLYFFYFFFPFFRIEKCGEQSWHDYRVGTNQIYACPAAQQKQKSEDEKRNKIKG